MSDHDHIHPQHGADHIHPHHGADHVHPHGARVDGGGRPGALDRRSLLRLGGMGLGALLLAACRSGSDGADGTAGGPATTLPVPSSGAPGSSTSGPATSTPPTSVPSTVTTLGAGGTVAAIGGFEAFAPTVAVFAEGDHWIVESDGMPAHSMMTGITSWQQQVPVAQPYRSANAWRFPIRPRLADQPVSARTGLFRGAIALAVNGVPIFNALNNRGDDALLAGELDQWGGHAGRADDYHYHVAPLHLQDRVGPGAPIAYALDGFAIYGQQEPDGSPVRPLDDYNGHLGADGVYHYHGTRTYPYINGGMRGVVAVSDQVEPQPVTKAFRPAGTPLRGAVITEFATVAPGRYRLDYSLGGGRARVDYEVSGGSVRFVFTDVNGATRTEVYSR